MTAKVARINQGGSVVSYIVVGVVLVALVVGGVYLLQHRTANDTAKVAKTTTVSPSPSPSSTPASSPSPSLAPAPATTSKPSASSAPTASRMPVTGPSDLMPAGIVIAILTGLGVSFTQSLLGRRNTSHQ